jgi:hypothetical protein
MTSPHRGRDRSSRDLRHGPTTGDCTPVPLERLFGRLAGCGNARPHAGRARSILPRSPWPQRSPHRQQAIDSPAVGIPSGANHIRHAVTSPRLMRNVIGPSRSTRIGQMGATSREDSCCSTRPTTCDPHRLKQHPRAGRRAGEAGEQAGSDPANRSSAAQTGADTSMRAHKVNSLRRIRPNGGQCGCHRRKQR